jgi:membrane protease YdiL (CAAX protease family)/GNAT superfamily N-acetyltransferase
MAEVVYHECEPLSDAELNLLFGGAWPDHEPRDYQQILDRSLVYLTARHDGQLIGYVNVATDGGVHAFLLDPTVLPDFRHRGIGTELVRRAVASAAERGAAWVHVDFVPELDAFYRKAGFRPTHAGLVQTTGAPLKPEPQVYTADEHGTSDPLPPPFNRLGATSLILLSFLGMGVVMAIGKLVLHIDLPKTPAATMSLFYLGGGAVLLYRMRRARVDANKLLGPFPTASNFRLTAIAVPLAALSFGSIWLMFVPLSYIAPTWVRNNVLESSTELAPDFASWLAFALVAVVIAPVLEEVFFRGILMQRWALKWGTLPGIITSSALFAVLHLDVIGTFLFAVAMCLLYLRTRSLWLPMAAHAINNLVATVGGLPGLIKPDERNPAALAHFQSQWWVGVALVVFGALLLDAYRRTLWGGVSIRELVRGELPYFAN